MRTTQEVLGARAEKAAYLYVAAGEERSTAFEIWEDGELLDLSPRFTEALRRVRDINRKRA